MGVVAEAGKGRDAFGMVFFLDFLYDPWYFLQSFVASGVLFFDFKGASWLACKSWYLLAHDLSTITISLGKRDGFHA